MEKAGRISRVMLLTYEWRPLIALLAFLLLTGMARGQDETTRNNQFWFAYYPTWRLRERWTLDIETKTRIIDSDPSSWQIRLQPTLTFSPRKWIDLTGGVGFIYTNQDETFDILEIRPTAGIEIRGEIWRGVQLSDYFRAERRIRRNLSDGETTSVTRLRNRMQAMIPINRKSLSEDKTWYALADAELFWQRDPQADDVFNSQRRYRVGIGWRKNAAWTFEFLYIFQRSIDAGGESFSTLDDIFNFNLIHTLK